MMYNDGRGALLWIEQESRRKVHADGLVGMQQRKQFGLVLEVWTRRIAGGVWRGKMKRRVSGGIPSPCFQPSVAKNCPCYNKRYN